MNYDLISAESMPRTIYNVQIMRGVAALNVVLFHIIGVSQLEGKPTIFLRFLSGWGQNGVDMFFVISGFVMVHTQWRRPKGSLDFLANRVARVVPLYWLLTMLMVALYVVLPGAFKSMSVDGFRLLRSLLFISAFHDRSPIIYVGWTLEIEMLFYLIFSISIAVNNKSAAAGFCVVALLISGAFWEGLPIEFLFGMGCAWLYIRHPHLPVGLPVLIGGTSLLIMTLWVPGYGDALGHARVLLWGAPSALILIGALYSPQLRVKFLLYLGTASYSIYLAQVFAIALFFKFLAHRLPLPADLLAAVALVLSAGFGCMVHELVEKPANFFWRSAALTRWKPRRPAVSSGDGR